MMSEHLFSYDGDLTRLLWWRTRRRLVIYMTR